MKSLKNHLLIAMPNISDPFFKQAVIYICEHNEDGAMGIMLNQITDISVSELVAKMNHMMADPEQYQSEQMVLVGGPVNIENGFVLHSKCVPAFQHSIAITPDIWLTTSTDVLHTLGRSDAPEYFQVALGCCSWSTQQIEQEITDNVWLVEEATPKLIFNTPYDQSWQAATQHLGIEAHLMSSQAGHA